MPNPPRELQHFLLNNHGASEPYTTPRNVWPSPPPFRHRVNHARMLRGMLDTAIKDGLARRVAYPDEILPEKKGFYLEVEMLSDDVSILDRLEKRQGKEENRIELINVRKLDDESPKVLATVYVPDSAVKHYEDKINDYKDKNTEKGNPKNAPLVARIEAIRIASVRSLFTDDQTLFPDNNHNIWWEVWLREGHQDGFFALSEKMELNSKGVELLFNDRRVVLVQARPSDLGTLLDISDAVAEIRLAKDNPSVFLDMDQVERSEWVDDLLARLQLPNDDRVSVCLLDTGVTRGHPLLNRLVPLLLSCDPEWRPEDHNGHGTAMAGLALYGDLTEALASRGNICVTHVLESVKIIPFDNNTDPNLYGWITTEAVGRAELEEADRSRAFCMAVTSNNALARGRPSSWSSQVDKICSGSDDDIRRLMLISAGNIRDNLHSREYPDRNDTEEIENPAQAWNALTVGAFTDKTVILDRDFTGWKAVAQAGDISPCSRTSVIWQRQWPIKPEVLFEGGNYAASPDGENITDHSDLSVLTTDRSIRSRLLCYFGETSSATALASRFAAKIMRERPDFWPESVRGIIVHSAQWSPVMKRQFNALPQQSRMHLLRRYGYGIPDIDRALKSARNDTTLIVQSEFNPFEKTKAGVKTKDMVFHLLPWPRNKLSELGDTKVELRITLSYFIEPSPGERGWTRRYTYASHGLRFDVQRPLESFDHFRQRLNLRAANEEAGIVVDPGGPEWYLGNLRDRGSIHSDIWTGTAANLANRAAIGIYPVGGWWRERANLEKYDKKARYSLMVTLSVPSVDVDIYSEIKAEIEAEAEIEVEIGTDDPFDF